MKLRMLEVQFDAGAIVDAPEPATAGGRGRAAAGGAGALWADGRQLVAVRAAAAGARSIDAGLPGGQRHRRRGL